MGDGIKCARQPPASVRAQLHHAHRPECPVPTFSPSAGRDRPFACDNTTLHLIKCAREPRAASQCKRAARAQAQAQARIRGRAADRTVSPASRQSPPRRRRRVSWPAPRCCAQLVPCVVRARAQCGGEWALLGGNIFSSSAGFRRRHGVNLVPRITPVPLPPPPPGG